MLLFCIESAQSFEHCEHSARVICLVARLTDQRRRERLTIGIAAVLPQCRWKRPQVDPTSSMHSPWPAPRIVTNNPASRLIERHEVCIRSADSRAGALMAMINPKPKRSEEPPQLRTPRQASASPARIVFPPSSDERSHAARIAGHRVT
jgi:hypothetical protein